MTKQGEDRIWRGAEKALRFFDATIDPSGDRWCWTIDDPEMTFDGPNTWLDCTGPWIDAPTVQKFEWGISAPPTWAVFYEGDSWPPVVEEYRSAEEAEARRAELASAMSAGTAETPEAAQGQSPASATAEGRDAQNQAGEP